MNVSLLPVSPMNVSLSFSFTTCMIRHALPSISSDFRWIGKEMFNGTGFILNKIQTEQASFPNKFHHMILILVISKIVPGLFCFRFRILSSLVTSFSYLFTVFVSLWRDNSFGIQVIPNHWGPISHSSSIFSMSFLVHLYSHTWMWRDPDQGDLCKRSWMRSDC